MNKEEKKAIKSMKRFVEGREDMTAVTASEMKTVLNLLEKKDKIIDEMTEELSKLNYIQYCNVTNCNYPPCNKEQCTKQYFERKVENGN